ncbi:hypothetical protein DFH07DRAFT_810328 [Mycena maculata]|uniref:Leucine rich repeat domain protein n=1 Tax=Mycena maculata TaxID=230809 RepID=A0AAD7JKS8_9AGAR|nr:hypothetical protein DFH07DRAFT_810328 [Mycena maculata]
MFSVDINTHWSTKTPSSSPPSSPTAYNDSSPASSPGPDVDSNSVQFPVESNDLGGASFRASPPLHPFAASSAAWIPPEYEKGGKKNRRRMSPSSPSRTRVKKARLVGPEASLETVVSSPRVSMSLTESERETSVWDAASSEMVDNANGNVNLENSNLSTIPRQFWQDVHRFCALLEPSKTSQIASLASPSQPPSTRQFIRSITAPAVLGSGLGFARQEIQLFLAGNQISRLPVQLLYLEKLTVLSLRNNNLKTLPPAIRYLKNLDTLNVSGNQLEYLPAEISEMSSLRTLLVFPNPFKNPEEPLSSQRQLNRTKSAQKRVVSPTTVLAPVPALTELLFRFLFSVESGSPTTTNHTKRRLALDYALPLCDMPSHLGRVFDAIHPGSVPTDASFDSADDQPSLGLCPSPHHTSASVFVEPVEERYTWEKVIAGHDLGGAVPLKWRGCSRGCLGFLDAEVETKQVDADVSEMEVDEENREQEAAVTVLQFPSSAGFGEADFDDG